MKLIGKRKLTKLSHKNKGNVKLQKCLKTFEDTVLQNVWTNQQELISNGIVTFNSVHPDGFYIADVNIHRAMVAITFVDLKELIAIEAGETDLEEIENLTKELGEVDVLWIGTHDEYELTFKNNKAVIEKWLRTQGYIP